MKPRTTSSAGHCLVPLRIVLSLIVVAMFAMPSAGDASARSAVDMVVDQAPTLPGVPSDIKIVAFGTLPLESGDYRWQATRLAAFPDATSTVTVHRGFLIAVNKPVTIVKADGSRRQVAGGSALPLAEGEQFAPVQVNGVAADLTIVELPLVADISPQETPDQVAPITLKQGTHIFAVLAIPARKPGDPTAGQLLAKAAGSGIAVYPRVVGEATPAADEKSGPFWLVAIFPASGTSSPSGSGTGGGVGAGAGDGNQSRTGQGQSRGTGSGNGSGGGGDGGSGSGGPGKNTVPAPTATTAVTPSPSPSPTSNPSPTPMATLVATMTPVPTATSGSGSGQGSTVLKDPNKTTNYSDLIDSDGDGLTKADEREAGTNPDVKDTDGDGLWDGPEVESGCHPLEKDTDGDGITDEGEILLYKTSCRWVDTDADGSSDYAEIFGTPSSDPLLADTDGDALSDFDEVTLYHSDPRYADSDADGWSDTYEALTTGTNPALLDGDFDCLSDPLEATLDTNPGLLDSDGDFLGDGQERSDGTNPLDSNDFRHLDEAQNPIPTCDGTYSLQ